ncbi:hypothetical protein IE81DRAFT_281644, partial [Ceraceosorus guamensis]
GPSRCYANWQEFMSCYASADTPTQCIRPRDDYLECLHHTKEMARAKTIREHWIQRQAHDAKKAREAGEVRATGSIMSLGLVEQGAKGE